MRKKWLYCRVDDIVGRGLAPALQGACCVGYINYLRKNTENPHRIDKAQNELYEYSCVQKIIILNIFSKALDFDTVSQYIIEFMGG